MNRALLHTSIIHFSHVLFARSSGPGGQNVNKVNTKVQIFMPILLIEGLTEKEITQVQIKLKTTINANNEIFIAVQDERSQEKNRAIAEKRLEEKIVQAAYILPKRKRTKPSRASKERRLQSKKRRSNIKKIRQEKF